MLVTFFLFSGCTNNKTDILVQTHSQIDEDNIREAVFRYQFEHNASGWMNCDTIIYFLSVGTQGYYPGRWNDRDPGNEFLNRFEKNNLLVKPFTECKFFKNKVIDKKTGAVGIIFRAGKIKWISNDKVEVEDGYRAGNISNSENTYYLSRENALWKVTKDLSRGIS